MRCNSNAGTEVTSDIIFLKKRSEPPQIEPEWVQLGHSEDGLTINKYFEDNPEMVLGKIVKGNKLYGRGNDTMCIPIEGKELKAQLNEAIPNLNTTISTEKTSEIVDINNLKLIKINIKIFQKYDFKVLIGSEIYNTLSDYPGIEFIQIDNRYAEISNKKGCFLNLYFRFVDHQQQVNEGEELKECMLFCIDDRNNGKTIFEQKIEFSETYFSNIIHKQENSKKRNYKLLEIAKKLMPGLKNT